MAEWSFCLGGTPRSCVDSRRRRIFGEQQLVLLRQEAQRIARKLQLRPLFLPHTDAWRNYQQMIDCHKRRQCDASLVAHDHQWLYVDPPRRDRPRMFSLTAAPETPRTPMTDSGSSCETREGWQNRLLKTFFRKPRTPTDSDSSCDTSEARQKRRFKIKRNFIGYEECVIRKPIHTVMVFLERSSSPKLIFPKQKSGWTSLKTFVPGGGTTPCICALVIHICKILLPFWLITSSDAVWPRPPEPSGPELLKFVRESGNHVRNR